MIAISSLWLFLWLQIYQVNAKTLITSAPPSKTKSSGLCPPTSPISPIPGCWGADGCAYIIVPDEQQCSENYCSCGPNDPAPLITERVSGTLSTHCDYTTFPPSQCPTGTSPAGPVTTETYVIDGVTLVGNPLQGFGAPSATLKPGGPPAIVASFTFSLPVSDSDGEIYVDGVETKLPPPETTSVHAATPVASSSHRTVKSTDLPSKTSIIQSSSPLRSSHSGKSSTRSQGSSNKGSPPSSSLSHSSSGSKEKPVSSTSVAPTTTGLSPSSNAGLSASRKTKTSQSLSSPPATSLTTRATITKGPGGNSLKSASSASSKGDVPSVYTIDGVALTGNPTSLSAAGVSAVLTPGASPLIISGHTFSIPVSATSGAINVDGTLTTLPTSSASASNVKSNKGGPTSASNSAAPGLGPGFGPVGLKTFTESGTTYTYDQVRISAFTTVGPTPIVATITFPEYDSKGQITSIIGPVIIGQGGQVIIHPPKIGPPGFGGPIRPPSNGKDCPSFFGVQFCPPGFNLPGSGGGGAVDPDDLPEGTDPENPDNEEDKPSTDNSKETKTQEKQSTNTQEKQSTKTSEKQSTSTKTGSTLSSSRRSSSSASSSVSSCSATGCGCAEYEYGPLATPDPLDDESQDTFKRALAGRVMYKRASSNSITKENVGQGKCAVSKYTAKPTYPGPTAISDNEDNQGKTAVPNMEAFYATATYWAVATTASLSCIYIVALPLLNVSRPLSVQLLDGNGKALRRSSPSNLILTRLVAVVKRSILTTFVSALSLPPSDEDDPNAQ